MSKDRGRLSRKLPDLGVYPDTPVYTPPGRHITENCEWPMAITDTSHIHVRTHHYRGFVVDFAIQQIHIYEDGSHDQVARIDCCRGIIHRHQYVRSTGEDIYDHRPIAAIPAQRGWQVVHDGYDAAFDAMVSEYEENEKRWRNG